MPMYWGSAVGALNIYMTVRHVPESAGHGT
jgi:hypothetical protein